MRQADPWAPQNDPAARQHHDETHDIYGNRDLGGPQATMVDVSDPLYWLDQARKAVRLLKEGHECVATTTGRLLMCCEELVRIALDRNSPSEAELLDDAEDDLEGD